MRTPYRSFSNLSPMVRSGVQGHKWRAGERVNGALGERGPGAWRAWPLAAASAAGLEDDGYVYPHHDSLTIFQNGGTTSIAGSRRKAGLGSEWSDSRSQLPEAARVW